ncbi:unnamed protein product [Ectocarpus sp. CCAP 1310/34]|nr:unnamed protein product [Ectocarpus sp. CCAP 1310/34]
MYLARAQASKRFLSGAAAGCPAASRNASKLPALGTERLSSSSAAVARHTGPLSTTHARVAGGLLPTAARWPAKSVAEARSARLLVRDQQTRSLGLFSGGGGISNQRLKELERMAAQSPSDANAEANFLVPLAEKYPQQAMSRFESGQFPINSASKMAYVKAASALGRMDQVDIQALMAMPEAGGVNQMAGTQGFGGAGAGRFAGAGGVMGAGGGGQGEPLRVTIDNPNAMKQNLFGLLQSTVKWFFVAVIMYSLFDLAANSKLVSSPSVHMAETSDKTFDDVVGVDEAKSELEEIVMYLKNPQMFTRLGGKLPRGLMLTGPPGTGKTLLARAIAGEAGVPFYYSSGSEFEEMFVGVGAKRVRELFAAAKKTAPCIIFIDEIDAIGSSRQLRDSSALKMTLNQLLVEMDGFDQTSNIIVIAATNFPQTLDHALTRPGRFDKHVAVPLPDVRGREQILGLYTSRTILDSTANLKALAQGTPGFSGADLSNLVNQAAVKASLDGAKAITTEALEWAKDKILMGAERRSAVISEETAKCTAFHEGGHAIVALKTAGAHPVHKATIMPRGNALGMVMQLPDGDQTSMSRKQMLAKMDVCMGGRVAEEMIFGPENVTSGATSDLEQASATATKIALAMVTQYGMSDKVGKVYMRDHQKEGPEMRAKVRDLLDKSYQRAWACLQTHRRDLDLLANALIKHETLTGAEIKDLLGGKPIKMAPVDVKMRSSSKRAPSSSSSSPTNLPVAKRPVATQD